MPWLPRTPGTLSGSTVDNTGVDAGRTRPQWSGLVNPPWIQGVIAPPSEVGVEESVANLVLWLKLAIEAVGVLMIGIGISLASRRCMRGSFLRRLKKSPSHN